jgi:DNA-binding response OmpR family regulator
VKAVLRRKETAAPPQPEGIIQAGKSENWFFSASASIENRPLELSPKEFDLLTAFVLDADRVISTDNLLKRVWVQNILEKRRFYMYIFAGCVKK